MFDSGSESDSGPVNRPMGRMAARMLQNGNAQEDAPTAHSAYDKIKAMIMGNPDQQNSDDASGTQQKTNMRSSPPNGSRSLPASDREASISPIRSSPPRPATTRERSRSPGIFVSSADSTPVKPRRNARAASDATDSDSDLPPLDNPRFKELVARKRAELKVQREAARKEREERRALNSEEIASPESESGSDDDGTKMTQQSRRGAPRKASKKALEEMNRETQRVSRNMQLAHQAKTKKKYTTKDLFKKFGFRQEKSEPEQQPSPMEAAPSLETTRLVSSDVEGDRGKDTPPTSPLIHAEEELKSISHVTAPEAEPAKSLKDKSLSLPETLEPHSLAAKDTSSAGRSNMGALVPGKEKAQVHRTEIEAAPADNSDSDDLEILPTKSSRFPVFDKLPTKKSGDAPQSLRRLRALANLTSPSKSGVDRTGKQTMNPVQLQNLLYSRAKEQARQERQEKIEQLKARGIFVMTAEEKEKEQLEMENMLEKARQADMELARKEKEAAKGENKDDADGLVDSEDDEEWEGSEEEEDGGEDDEENDEMGLSGSDEEENASHAELSEGGESDREEHAKIEEPARLVNLENESDDDLPAPVRTKPAARHRQVVDDDSDSEAEETHGQSQALGTPISTASQDIAAAFGFVKSSPAIGLTQMFAGTMPDSVSQDQTNQAAAIVSHGTSIDFLRQLPASTVPDFDELVPDDSQDLLVRDSQAEISQQDEVSELPQDQRVNLQISQFETQMEESQTQLSQLPDPTQDVGFQMPSSPAALPKPPASTVDTVVLGLEESPLAKKKGRLRRRNQRDDIPVLSDLEEDEVVPEVGSDTDGENDAFAIMKRKAMKKQKVDAFNKKKSAAKEMFEEQAQESEDEYAGLGGASDDDSGDDADEEMRDMIDETDIKVNEREVAAFFAEKDRVEDERRVDKLYKDIMNGGLRRKRGNDLDLSDSDEDITEQRRKKRRQFAEMRKALLADENIGKIAENPKKQAFFRAIEDRDDDSDAEFLDVQEDEPDSIPDSQEPIELQAKASGEAPGVVNPLKRKAESHNDENRPPPHHRRTAPTGNKPPALRKPTTLAEIRESVSFLIDEPNMIPDSQYDSESEGEMEQQDTDLVNAERAPAALRRTRAQSTVIDRVSLSRSTSITETSSGSVAFVSSKPASQGRFKVPSLVRRATSRLSESTVQSASSSTASSAAQVEGAKVRRGGSARSNIHYQAREAERKRVIDAAEEKRKEGLRRKVKAGGSGGLKSVLGGMNGWD